MNLSTRSSGVLLHLSSLPGPPFCGSLGASARQFVDFLHEGHFRWWQMLPINPIDECHSPYSSASSFAGDTLYIDLEDIVNEGLLDHDDITWQPSVSKTRALFAAARDFRQTKWRKAFERFREGRGGEKYRNHYEAFAAESPWLASHAIFAALAEKFGTRQWSQWNDATLRRPTPQRLAEVSRELEDEIAYHLFLQCVFDFQWQQLKRYCHERNVGLIGDVPIYVAGASVDTWANPTLFQIEPDGHLERVAGVPADAFNPDGQRWNAPLYRWEEHASTGYAWWIDRLKTCFRRFDAVRLDHFIGFYNYFSLPVEPTPNDPGAWIPGPGAALFDAVKTGLPNAQLIAEDLGVLKEGVTNLRQQFGLPGMKVYQFQFDFRANTNPIDSCDPNTVVCTGTHDTNTLSAWLDEVAADRLKPEPFWDWNFLWSQWKSFVAGTPEWHQRFGGVPRPDGSPRHAPSEPAPMTRQTVLWSIIESVLHSPGNVAIFPMQDILGLGGTARMNFPGHVDDNWLWRMDENAASIPLAHHIAYLNWLYERKM
ncbi:MAG: 4-alpha-glucanotransferase [Thermoguttaceae bacterium]